MRLFLNCGNGRKRREYWSGHKTISAQFVSRCGEARTCSHRLPACMGGREVQLKAIRVRGDRKNGRAEKSRASKKTATIRKEEEDEHSDFRRWEEF